MAISTQSRPYRTFKRRPRNESWSEPYQC